MKHFFTASLVAIIALAFWGMRAYEKKMDISVVEETAPHFIDLYMNNFILTAMDENGIPSYTLQASHLEHYKDKSHSTIVQPVIRLLKANNRWLISAQNGEIDELHNRIVLKDNVVMMQEDKEHPVELKTSSLEIDTARQIAQTDQTVYIVQQKFKLQSDGMILDNTTGKLELLTSVEGSYARAH